MQISPGQTNVKFPDSTSLAFIIFKNTTYVAFGNIILKLLNFLFSIYVIRSLGDSRFGQYSIVLGFVGLVQIVAELGISQFIMREISRDKSLAKKYFWNLVSLRLILAFLGIMVITQAARIIGYNPQLVFGIFLYSVTFIPAAFTEPLNSLLTAHEKFGLLTIINIIGQIFFMLFGAIFMFLGFSYIWLIVASLISFLPNLLISFRAVKKNGVIDFPFKLSPEIWWKIIKSGLPFGMISLALSIDFSVDTFMLSFYVPDNQVGWYNVAYGLLRSFLFIFVAFNKVIVPSLTKIYDTEPETVNRWYFRTIKFYIILAIPFSTGGMLLALPLFNSLYTPEYLPAAIVFQVIIWGAAFLLFSSFCGQITTITSKENLAMKIYGLSAIFNVMMNLIMIPRFGIMGAAFITVLTDIFIAALFFVVLKKAMQLPPVFTFIFRSILAASIMGIILWCLKSNNFLLLVGFGIIIYFISASALKVLDKEDWRLIKLAFQKSLSAIDGFLNRNAVKS